MIRALAALPLALAALTPPAQFRASVDVVRIEALALERGRPIGGITAADFHVTDNGATQAITVRPLGTEGVDVVVALDTSGSVEGERLEHLQAGTRALVAQLTARDRATLVVFNHALLLDPADAVPGILGARIGALTAQGRTSLVDAVTTALVWSAGRERPTLAIVFSDGLDTASWTRLDQALTLAKSTDVVVDAVVAGEMVSLARLAPALADAQVGLPGRQQPTASERFLHELTGLTGGRVRDGDAGDRLAGAFREALEHFRARYEITYTPTGTQPGWHEIDVKVVGRRGTSVQARKGYQR
jgi:Ca-activated chloride channel homolog